jgi:hypothetical protein
MKGLFNMTTEFLSSPALINVDGQMIVVEKMYTASHNGENGYIVCASMAHDDQPNVQRWLQARREAINQAFFAQYIVKVLGKNKVIKTALRFEQF